MNNKTILSRIIDQFTPNKSDNSASFMVLMACWLTVLVFLWATAPASFIPTPIKVIQAFPDLWNEQGFGVQLFTSLALNFDAIVVMFILSYTISILTVLPVFRPLATLISAGRFNGFVGMPLIFTAIFHDDVHKIKVALLVYGMGVFTVLSLVKLFQDIPKEKFDHSRTLRMSEWRVVWEVVVLGTFDKVIDIMKINIAMGFMMLPMVEGRFRFEGGVGALMENNAKYFEYSAVFCALLVILFVGLLQDYVLTWLKKLTCPHASVGLERS